MEWLVDRVPAYGPWLYRDNPVTTDNNGWETQRVTEYVQTITTLGQIAVSGSAILLVGLGIWKTKRFNPLKKGCLFVLGSGTIAVVVSRLAWGHTEELKTIPMWSQLTTSNDNDEIDAAGWKEELSDRPYVTLWGQNGDLWRTIVFTRRAQWRETANLVDENTVRTHNKRNYNIYLRELRRAFLHLHVRASDQEEVPNVVEGKVAEELYRVVLLENALRGPAPFMPLEEIANKIHVLSTTNLAPVASELEKARNWEDVCRSFGAVAKA